VRLKAKSPERPGWELYERRLLNVQNYEEKETKEVIL